MATSKNRVVIVGANIFGESILKALREKWEIVCIDVDENLISSLREKYPDVDFIVGDAGSLLTWKKLKEKNDYEGIKHIISTVRDADVSLELCRITKEILDIQAKLYVLLFFENREEEFEKYHVEILKPTDLITKILLTKIEKNYSVAINIGLGQGEIIEIHILARSHLVDRKLKYLKATRWKIAAIYRDGKLIVPFGDEKVKIGDKVVIVGDPKVLHNLVEILTKGVPQFPQQFGSNIAVVYNKSFFYALEEAVFLKKNTKAHKILIFPYKTQVQKSDIQMLTDNFEIEKTVKDKNEIFESTEDIGLVVYPLKKNIFPFLGCKLRKVFQKAKKPFLIPSGNFPYKRIVISLNCPDPAFVLSIGIELSRLLKVPYQVIYVTLPEELRGFKEEEALKEREEIIKDYEQIYKTTIDFKHIEGNPVKETVKYVCGQQKDTLFVISYDKKQKISFLEPHVQFLIVKKINCSSLVIPLETEEIYG